MYHIFQMYRVVTVQKRPECVDDSVRPSLNEHPSSWDKKRWKVCNCTINKISFIRHTYYLVTQEIIELSSLGWLENYDHDHDARIVAIRVDLKQISLISDKRKSADHNIYSELRYTDTCWLWIPMSCCRTQ